MRLLNTVKIIFCLAVLLFIAKPFMGYVVLASGNGLKQPHSIMVKIFSKRKPEDLEDAKTIAAAIHQKLINPPVSLTLLALLAFVFPFVYKRSGRISYSSLNELNVTLVPIHHPYFLSGKLTI